MEYSWTGAAQPFFDKIGIRRIGPVHSGAFGGSTSNGAHKNEDACYVLVDDDHTWVFTALLDAHHTSQSAEIMIELLEDNKSKLLSLFNSNDVFSRIEPFFLSLFTDPDFKDKCSKGTGETSCLLCFQQGEFLWWFSIGDCMAFLFHPDLARLGQYGLNQRQFFEWIGQVNTFDLSVPCYTSGRRRLRQGMNQIVLMTDCAYDRWCVRYRGWLFY